MKVRMSDIPPQGLPISATMSLEALNTRMNEGNNNDIIFTSPPHVRLTVFKALGGGEAKGTITTKYRRPCGLCMDELDQDLSLPVSFVIKEKPAPKRSRNEDDRPAKDDVDMNPDDGQYADDVGIFYYEGDNFELEEPLQELLILSLSPFWHPPREAVSGNCSRCGRNPCPEGEADEEGLGKLGEIFKKVGLH